MMARHNLETRVEAILARHYGVPYSQVLKDFCMTPIDYARAVFDLERIAMQTNRKTRAKLLSIARNDNLRTELFRMEEETIQEQYDRISGRVRRAQRKYYPGTFVHPDNLSALAYYALGCHHRALKSGDRVCIVKTIKGFPEDLVQHFLDIKLRGVLAQVSQAGFVNSPLAVMQSYDEVYQEKTGDASLFDQDQPIHLHPWGHPFSFKHYWRDPLHVEDAIYHLLTEQHTTLASENRELVVGAIDALPDNLTRYFYTIELGPIMVCGFPKGRQNSPLAVIEAYDRVWQRETGQASLFDLDKKIHLHPWGERFRAYAGYWNDPQNVMGAVYHTLAEHNPALASLNRGAVIQALAHLPANRHDYFEQIGLESLMKEAFPSGQSHVTGVLKAFDRGYQARSGDASLFDPAQDCYLALTRRKAWPLAA